MDLYLPQQKENQRTGLIVTIAVHVLLLILFFFYIVWSEQQPPIGKVGIPGVMIDFGNSNLGKGEVKSRSEKVTETVEEPASPETSKQPVTEPVETASKAAEQPVATAPSDNPHKVSTKTEPKTSKKTETKETQKPAEQPKIDPRFTMGSSGDGKDKTEGNKGKKDGLDGNHDSGTTKGDGGTNGLDKYGWGWHTPPQKHTGVDRGFMVFKFQVDDAGNFVDVKLISSTALPSTEAHYLQQLRDRARLLKTGDQVQYQGTFKIDLSVQ